MTRSFFYSINFDTKTEHIINGNFRTNAIFVETSAASIGRRSAFTVSDDLI